MNKTNITVSDKFLLDLSKHNNKKEELKLKTIYSIFPEMNKKTISWRLHSLVKEGKIYKTGHGIYSLNKDDGANISAGYEYLQRKSQEVYDSLSEYGYEFYISGLDSLVGEILHLPEEYPVIIVAEADGIKEIQEILYEKDMIVFTEKDLDILEKTILWNKMDAIILKGKEFSLAVDNISLKEKGFIDLYYAVTRMEYQFSVAELSRIYESLQRNNSITLPKIRLAAMERGIIDEINWLININKMPKKVIEFMNYQLKETE